MLPGNAAMALSCSCSLMVVMIRKRQHHALWYPHNFCQNQGRHNQYASGQRLIAFPVHQNTLINWHNS